jgi:hypothetical protein
LERFVLQILKYTQGTNLDDGWSLAGKRATHG